MDEHERGLIERARSDPEAFGLLYDRQVAGIYRFVYARVGNAAAAEDVTAEVFINALRAIGRYQDRGRPFSCWLYRIASNAIASHFRHEPENRELTDAMPDGALPVEVVALRHLEIESVWHLVDQLPPQQRRAMTLRFRDDLSAHDAARVMGKSDAAVKLLIYRAVGRLRSQLSPTQGGAPVRSALAVS
ncbi:MAG: sigma-70 family RNA polymerase sigma factor [Chloroflexi bacterium]|nr:MAG: sigma-70 family RNA polymerase sigma factor [Chloroflexota bacterium]